MSFAYPSVHSDSSALLDVLLNKIFNRELLKKIVDESSYSSKSDENNGEFT